MFCLKMAENRKVCYIFSKSLQNATDNIKNIKQRGAVVHSLISSYNLLQKCQIVESVEASENDILLFHSSTYVEYLKSVQDVSDLEKAAEDMETAEFNLEYDCPLFEDIYSFVKVIAGGTLSAIRLTCPILTRKENVAICQNVRPRSYLKYRKKKPDIPYIKNVNATVDATNTKSLSKTVRISEQRKHIQNISQQFVSINWFGGWHHAQRDSAEGFCYVNDIVIGIQFLLKFFKRVLYVDLDVHHGNGVENAFAHTTHVMTASFHKYGLGYYPGTGSVQDVGIGPGKYYAVNVPLKDGITDNPYTNIFSQVMNEIKEVYNPEYLVIQCGADCLSGDPLGGFNLTLKALGFCVNYLLEWKLPTTLLGGGGYKIANAARCYAYLTSVVLGQSISSSIPENDYFHLFGPDFELGITPSYRRDENSETYLKSVLDGIKENLNNLKET